MHSNCACITYVSAHVLPRNPCQLLQNDVAQMASAGNINDWREYEVSCRGALDGQVIPYIWGTWWLGHGGSDMMAWT
jgi:hypothetical protein